MNAWLKADYGCYLATAYFNNWLLLLMKTDFDFIFSHFATRSILAK
jgi:hypothetical protein